MSDLRLEESWRAWWNVDFRRGTKRSIAATIKGVIPGSVSVAIEEPVQTVPLPRRWWEVWKIGKTIKVGGVVDIFVMTKDDVPDALREECLRAVEDVAAAGITLRLRFFTEVR